MNIQEMMRQAQKMKAKMEKVQDEVRKRTFEGSAGGGMVVVTANGKNEIVSVKLEKDVVNPEDLDMLQDLIVAATNQAISRATEVMTEEMSKVTGGMGIPGVF
jgi:DNA-binding YbaB/EbfC family protein